MIIFKYFSKLLTVSVLVLQVAGEEDHQVVALVVSVPVVIDHLQLNIVCFWHKYEDNLSLGVSFWIFFSFILV